MSHGKIGFLIVTFVVLAISLSIIGLACQAMMHSQIKYDPKSAQARCDDQRSPTKHPPPKSIRAFDHFIDTLAGNVDRRPDAEGGLEDNDYRDEQDLIAQRIMARWTFGIFIASFLSIPISLVGIGLVYVTFRETRNAAEAAQDTVSVTRDLGQREIRAYIGIEGASYENIIVGGLPKAAISFKNFGHTPATNVRACYNWAQQTEGVPKGFGINWSGDVPGSIADLHQGVGQAITHPAGRVLTSTDINLIEQEVIELFFVGLIEYRDVFGVEQSTTFRFEIDIERMAEGKGQFVISKEGNKST